MDIFFAVMATLLFVTILGGVTGFLTVDKLKSIFSAPASDEVDDLAAARELEVIIIHKIQEIKEFGVFRHAFESTFPYSDKREAFGVALPLTSTELKVHYKGMVVCGCDLEQATYMTDARRKRMKIVIPCGKILDIYEIPGTLSVEEKKSGIFSRKIDLEKYDKELKADLEKMRRHLINDGILQETNEFVADALKGLISGVDSEIQAEIIFMGETPAPERIGGTDNPPRLNDGR